ncbi:MAG: hypothetical protein AAFP04_00740, partial [Myxococcota bacterium]
EAGGRAALEAPPSPTAASSASFPIADFVGQGFSFVSREACAHRVVVGANVRDLRIDGGARIEAARSR